MKGYFLASGLVLSLLFLSATSWSCNRGTGCPANESLSAKTDRKGNYSKKGASTHLFSKKTRKKMKN